MMFGLAEKWVGGRHWRTNRKTSVSFSEKRVISVHSSLILCYTPWAWNKLQESQCSVALLSASCESEPASTLESRNLLQLCPDVSQQTGGVWALFPEPRVHQLHRLFLFPPLLLFLFIIFNPAVIALSLRGSLGCTSYTLKLAGWWVTHTSHNK